MLSSQPFMPLKFEFHELWSTWWYFDLFKQLTASKDQNHGTQGGNSCENLMHKHNAHNVFEEAILKQEDSSMKVPYNC